MKTKRKGDSRNKRTQGEIDSDRVFIAELYSKGKSQREITEKINESRHYSLTRQSIALDIAAILEEWRLHAAADISLHHAEQLIKLNRVESEAWSAFERSRSEAWRMIEETRDCGEDGEKQLSRVQKEERDGDPRFMMIVVQCIQERSKLMGLYAASKLQHTGPDGMPLPAAALIPQEIRITVTAKEEKTDDYKIIPLKSVQAAA